MSNIDSIALFFSLLAVGAVTATFVLVAMQWRSVRGRIPRHFDILGRPDGWSGGWILWFYPSFALVFAAGMALLFIVTARSGDATTETAEACSACGAVIASLMFVLAERSIAIAKKRAKSLGWMVLPCLAIIIVLLVRHYS